MDLSIPAARKITNLDAQPAALRDTEAGGRKDNFSCTILTSSILEALVATAKEYFEKNRDLEFVTTLSFKEVGGEDIAVPIKVAYDFEGGSKYIKAYIPDCNYPDNVALAIVQNLEALWNAAAGLEVSAGISGGNENVKGSSLAFSGRIIVYTPTMLGEERWQSVIEQLLPFGIHLLARDGQYAKLRDSYERPKAFISHDSRDKDIFVRELANKLSSMLCPVWYDEYSLIPGQSLRESIEHGLKTCPKCVVVLSKNFFGNPGWTKREFDTVYTREIIEGKRVIVPVWLDVARQDVYDYSPVLADIVGINAQIGIDEVARKLFAPLNAGSN